MIEVIIISKTSTQVKERYNKKAYARYTIRIRKDSPLYDDIEDFMAQNSSLNSIVTKLLEKYFSVTSPAQKGGTIMGYETKVILKAIVSLLKRAKDLDEAIQLVTDIANAEDVIIETDTKKEKE